MFVYTQWWWWWWWWCIRRVHDRRYGRWKRIRRTAMIDARTTLESRADLTETNADHRPSVPDSNRMSIFNVKRTRGSIFSYPTPLLWRPLDSCTGSFRPIPRTFSVHVAWSPPLPRQTFFRHDRSVTGFNGNSPSGNVPSKTTTHPRFSAVAQTPNPLSFAYEPFHRAIQQICVLL